MEPSILAFEPGLGTVRDSCRIFFNSLLGVRDKALQLATLGLVYPDQSKVLKSMETAGTNERIEELRNLLGAEGINVYDEPISCRPNARGGGGAH